MSTQNLLWFSGVSDVLVDPQWQPCQSVFHTVKVANLNEAIHRLKSEGPHCVLVTGDAAEGDRLLVLESLQGADPRVPIVFYNPAMTAADAVQLVRNGAYHCFGDRDSLERLDQCL